MHTPIHSFNETKEDAGLILTKPLFKTTHTPTADELRKLILAFAESKRDRAASKSKGRARPVVVTAVKDVSAYLNATRTGLYSPAIIVGSRWATAQEASEALGLGRKTLNQLFYAARRTAGTGFTPSVAVRGLELSYDDKKEGRNDL